MAKTDKPKRDDAKQETPKGAGERGAKPASGASKSAPGPKTFRSNPPRNPFVGNKNPRIDKQ